MTINIAEIIARAEDSERVDKWGFKLGSSVNDCLRKRDLPLVGEVAILQGRNLRSRPWNVPRLWGKRVLIVDYDPLYGQYTYLEKGKKVPWLSKHYKIGHNYVSKPFSVDLKDYA